MLIRWNDFGPLDFGSTLSELEQLKREMNRTADRQPPRQSPTAFPRIGLFDAGEALVVQAELPGMAEDELDISLDDTLLTLRGTRKVSIPEGYSVHRQERAETTFARSYTLPCKVDAEKSMARIKNGVLTLTMNKAPEVQPKQITVKAG